MEKQQIIEQFFHSYEDEFNSCLSNQSTDVKQSASAFADCFVAAGPSGVQCGKNDDSFLAAIPQGYDFYRSAGITSMNIVATERTMIDDLHAMVKVTWRSEYINKEGVEGNIVFNVTYILQIVQESCKIFAWITGDEQAALKEHGLI